MDVMIERIENLCKEKDVSKAKVGRDLDFSNTAFTNWKSRRQKPSLENIMKLARYFDVSIDFLVGFTDNPEINK